ncbi:cysteine desulfurase [Proteiniclasticum sp. BAD-10]|uniref:cysteine desulfurase n=1 Tax=Proteiniclasticum sediminis TaxID=2804028 RepID=A0A941HRH0_9CLOT|nr:cysteine desulfurase family protein [Proteiniclasticum sediminis]MBR0576970.1 cysteine desulfurase [Proteiniclasticum sediminis]
MYYLDHAATTPLHPEVISVMIKYLQTDYGNPSSKYYPQAMSASSALKESRKCVADLLNCDPEFILFTSGSTESNNFVLKGVVEKYRNKGNHIITSKIEHKSIIETCRHLERLGTKVSYLSVNSEGHIDLNELISLINESTLMVSLMWGNNEIGVVNDVEQISRICHERGVLFHTDATQVVGKIEIDLKKTSLDFLSISAHKIGGPKGVGAVFVGPDDLGLRRRIPSLMDGGDQEYKMRSGTQGMHNIVGFAKACEMAKANLKENNMRLLQLEKKFKEILVSKCPGVKFNGDQINKIPGLLSISIPGINNELLCKQISNQIAISTGSACSIGEKSHVLEALDLADSTSTIRVSLPADLDNVEEVASILLPYISLS